MYKLRGCIFHQPQSFIHKSFPCTCLSGEALLGCDARREDSSANRIACHNPSKAVTRELIQIVPASEYDELFSIDDSRTERSKYWKAWDIYERWKGNRVVLRPAEER